MIKNFRLPLLFTFLLLLTNCKSAFKFSNNNLNLDREHYVRVFDVDQIKGKAKLKYVEDGSKITAKANFRMKRDSIIWIQLSGAGGIEGGRFIATKDSVIFLDRLNKRIRKFDYLDLKKRYGFEITFDQFQSALVGNFINLENGTELINKGKKEGVTLLKSANDNYDISYLVNSDSAFIKTVDIKQKESEKKVHIDYLKYGDVGGKAFPIENAIDFTFEKFGRTIKVVSRLKFSKVEAVEKKLRFPFSIPDKYEVE